MRAKLIRQVYDLECHLFKCVNQHFDRKGLNAFFRTITHAGGATFTISMALLFMFVMKDSTKLIAYASAFSLAVSHIPVAIAKKLYPRKRPYLQLEHTKVLQNPLKDHSFPSGHTTAIFSFLTPFMIAYPLLMTVLLPLAVTVGLSRIYLGLHYPTDVLVGMLLGILSAVVSLHIFI
ncbi:phosphatase PAP2 family protein [Priestia megaterium]|nr:phosphatase PAP2 family protein [Priestia megaterium]